MAPINWYYKINGEEHGPVTSDDLRKMAVAGTLNPNDHVRKEDMSDWVSADRLKGLEFANTDYSPYDEEYDPDSETYDDAEYARTRGSGPESLVYAGFWLRFCAAFIDGIIMNVIQFCIGFALGFSMAVLGLQDEVFIQIISMVLGVLVFWLYFASSESSAAQATPGKRALGLKVTDLDGRRISFGRASGRTFAKYLSYFTLLIGFIMAGMTEKKQALHDMIASCLVVKK